MLSSEESFITDTITVPKKEIHVTAKTASNSPIKASFKCLSPFLYINTRNNMLKVRKEVSTHSVIDNNELFTTKEMVVVKTIYTRLKIRHNRSKTKGVFLLINKLCKFSLIFLKSVIFILH